ncbi:MAG: MerR family transcriptional regulator [Eubacterium sp.]|nr:MerR family transcriptional regulator [Eubacterium sp.]
MTIKEVEKQTGLPRSNIRFYEKEELIVPSRNKSNGYRDYSESDIEDIKKIAFLRTLGVSIEDIRNVMSGRTALHEMVQKQHKRLESQMADLNKAKMMCEKMLQTKNIEYKNLQVNQFVAELQEYWNGNKPVFKLDSVSFLYIWGSFITWIVITALCFFTALLFYRALPSEIPIQWSGGAASSLVDKKFIFAYPAACGVIRWLLRPFLYARLQRYPCYVEVIAEYLTNYLCFVAFSVEIFSVLFVFGVAKNIVMVLIVDTVVLLGLLAVGLKKN